MPSSACDWSSDVCSDRKSTRLNSSHDQISYAVFCSKKNIAAALGHLAEHLELAWGEWGGGGEPPAEVRDHELLDDGRVDYLFFFKEWGDPRNHPPFPAGPFPD